MKKSEVMVAVVCIGIGMGISYGGYLLDLGGLHTPGAGFFPFFIGTAIIILSFLHIINQFFLTKPSKENVFSWPGKKGIIQVSKVFLSLVIYALCLEYLGFLLCTFLIMFYLLKFIGLKKWSYSLIISIIIAFSSFLIFGSLLRLGLPKGFLSL